MQAPCPATCQTCQLRGGVISVKPVPPSPSLVPVDLNPSQLTQHSLHSYDPNRPNRGEPGQKSDRQTGRQANHSANSGRWPGDFDCSTSDTPPSSSSSLLLVSPLASFGHAQPWGRGGHATTFKARQDRSRPRRFGTSGTSHAKRSGTRSLVYLPCRYCVVAWHLVGHFSRHGCIFPALLQIPTHHPI